jgi:N-acetylmuramoyl-L-alanine amidase
MATTTTNPETITGTAVPAHLRAQAAPSDSAPTRPSQHDALQALIAFSALHEQVRRRKALAAHHSGFDAGTVAEFDEQEQFLLDEVLQLVAERAVAITGADGLAIALAENNEIVLRAAAGTVRPDVGARIDRDSAFSGACFQQAQIVICDDTETDTRVNLEACRKLGARSMVAVPLCGRRRVIGVLEAFSSWPFGFNDSDVRNLSLLAELVLGALKPEDEDRFAQSAQIAEKKLTPAQPATPISASIPLQVSTPKAPAPPAATPSKVPLVSAAPLVSVPKTTPAPTAPLAPAQNAAPPVVVTKPAVTETSSAPAASVTSATTVLDKPAIKPAPETNTTQAAIVIDSKQAVEAPADVEQKTEVAAADDSALAPDLTFGQIEPARKARPAMVYLLLSIVVVAAFAGGVWWKLKTAQLGSVIVHTEKMTPKPPDAAKSSTTQPPTSAAAYPAAANANPDAISDSVPEDTAPATAQELTKFPRVTGIRHWSSTDSSTVVLDLEDQVQYEAHRIANPDRIYFDLHDTQLAPELTGKSIEIGDALLNRVRVAQPVAGMTRVVLETKANSNFSVSLEPNPYRLVVEVRKPGTAPRAVNLFPNSDAEKKLLAIVVPPPTKEDLALRARVPKMKIVVDAGHGGWDLGTVGRRGLLEKDLVLEIATRLGKLLESRLGADVIFTRPDDNYVTLDDRAMIANQAQADLFVSVHANYSDLPSARGVETYYTNFFTAPGAKEADSKNTDPHANGGFKPATPTLSATDLHERIAQSQRLAASVQRSLYGTLSTENPGLRDRGIKEAGFVVLTESAMPGILAEVSFVSSPTDEQKLRSDGYREEIAEALYRGIARYAAASASKNVKVASAAK